jgi:hypothetical protein
MKFFRRKKTPAYLFKVAAVTYFIFLQCSCKVKVVSPPTFANCSVTLQGIFRNCHNPLTSAYPIEYSGTFTTYYIQGSTNFKIGTVSFINGSLTGSPNQTFVAKIPAAGSNSNWYFILNIVGVQCSTCAQMGGNNGCTQTNYGNVIAAGKPTITRQSQPSAQYYSSLTLLINEGYVAENVYGSCGCYVNTN